jgi:hypothetical protein
MPIWRYRYMGVFPEATPYPWLRAYHEGIFSHLISYPVTNEQQRTFPYSWEPTPPSLVQTAER